MDERPMLDRLDPGLTERDEPRRPRGLRIVPWDGGTVGDGGRDGRRHPIPRRRPGGRVRWQDTADVAELGGQTRCEWIGEKAHHPPTALQLVMVEPGAAVRISLV